MQGSQVQSLVPEDSTCKRAPKPVHHNYWARLLQLLKPTHLESVLCDRRAHHRVRSLHATWRVGPAYSSQREPAHRSEDLVRQKQINKKKLYISRFLKKSKDCFTWDSQMVGYFWKQCRNGLQGFLRSGPYLISNKFYRCLRNVVLWNILFSYTLVCMLDFTGTHPKVNERSPKSDPKQLESVIWEKPLKSPGRGGDKTKNKELKTITETMRNLEDREDDGTSEYRFSPRRNKTDWN